MAINFDAAQLVVGAAIIDARYRRLLMNDRSRALAEVTQDPCAGRGLRLTAQDRLELSAIRARDLREFALGIERSRRVVRAAPAAPAAASLGLVGS
jgi:hypothetical protein